MFRGLVAVFILALFLYAVVPVQAQTRALPSRVSTALVSPSPVATASAITATGSAVVEKVLEQKHDITETGGGAKGKLEQFLSERPIGPLTITNVLQYAIRNAVERGVPANTVVLIFLFPLITAIIAAFRHVIGLHGFGLFVPAILAVAFTASGIVTGIGLFVIILLVATVARILTRELRLQYLPRMSLIMWLVSLGVFGALLLAAMVGFAEAAVLSIFPILILILLAENFIEVQMSKSQEEAIEVTVESLVMAVAASAVVSWDVVQKLVLSYPEWYVILVAAFNIFVGRYVGLRVLELWKFREMLRK